uniref:Cytochrome P450 n=1 Tax=Photinus pyralis TaxID=7054 RepID=A0A1Y1MBZ7_PHOPY
MLYVAALIVLLIYIINKIQNINNYWKRKGVKQLPPLPLLGNTGTLFQKTSPVDLWHRIYNSFPNERYFGVYQFTTPTLLIKDLNLIKRITVKDFDTFPEHASVVPEDADPLFARNILFMKGGQKWQRLRSLLSPAFTSYKLKTMYPLMVSCAEQLVRHYEMSSDDVITLEMKETFSKYASDIIGTTAFGLECNTFSNPDNIFYKMGQDSIAMRFSSLLKIIGYGAIPAVMKFLGIAFLPRHVSDFFRKIVLEAMQQRAKQDLQRPDVLNLLLEARKGRLKYEDVDETDTSFATVQESELGKVQKFKSSDISDDDLIAQAVIFFLAGFDTSSTALTFAAYELAINPDVQRRLQEEVDAAVEDCGGFVTYDTLISMSYMDLVVTETLRMWPPLTFTDRRAVKPFTIEPEESDQGTVCFDSGTICVIPVHAIHMDQRYYPNPKKFDPDRFSAVNKQTLTPFAYLPFGAGPKGCIGTRFALLEVKLVLCAILNKFDIIPVPETKIPVVTKRRSLFLGAEGGMWLGLKKRDKL